MIGKLKGLIDSYGEDHVIIDVQGEYYFRKQFAVFASLRDLGVAQEDLEIAGPSTPPHAQFRSRQDFGSLWTFGVKGTF